MLLECPLQHLHCRKCEEHISTKHLRHDGETQPGHGLPEVVSAAHILEHVPLRDASFRRARLAEVSKNAVAREVHRFAEHELPRKNAVGHISGPRWCCVAWVQEEVHRQVTKNGPVVSTIFDNVGPGHRVVGETVHIQSLILTFAVVHERHGNTQLLHVQERWVRAINLRAEDQ
jgi:hypothetical protein